MHKMGRSNEIKKQRARGKALGRERLATRTWEEDGAEPKSVGDSKWGWVANYRLSTSLPSTQPNTVVRVLRMGIINDDDDDEIVMDSAWRPIAFCQRGLSSLTN
jgi:hypothetical protein